MTILDSAVKIGKKSAPNRIVNQPMECNDADEQGNPTELTFGRYRKLAEGGAGIIFLEALTITPESRARKNQLGIYEKTAPRLERLVQEMRSINSQSLILFQITHFYMNRSIRLYIVFSFTSLPSWLSLSTTRSTSWCRCMSLSSSS